MRQRRVRISLRLTYEDLSSVELGMTAKGDPQIKSRSRSTQPRLNGCSSRGPRGVQTHSRRAIKEGPYDPSS